MLDKGMLSMFTTDDNPGSSPHLVKIYAQPCRTAKLVEPLLGWLKCILTGPNPYFLTLVKASDKLDDWGIKADLLCYWDLKDSLQEADTEAKKWDAHAMAFAQARNLCRSHLEVAHTGYQLANYESLGPQQFCKPQLACCGHRYSPIMHRHINVVRG
jgi:hypothetical protein